MPSQSDSDSGSSTLRRNPPRGASIPTNAVPYVREYLPTRMANSPQASTHATVGVATPPRKRTRSQPQDRLSSETPVGSDPPTPTQERENPEDPPSAKRPKKGKERAAHEEAIYDMQYSELENDLDRVVWLLGMLEPITGREHALKSYTLAQLEQLFFTKTGTKLYRPDAANASVGGPSPSAVVSETPRQQPPGKGTGTLIPIAPAASSTPRSTYRLGAVTPVPGPALATSKRVPTTNLRIVTQPTPSTRTTSASQPKSVPLPAPLPAPVPAPVLAPIPAPSPEQQDTATLDEDVDTPAEIDREAIEREYEAELREFDRVERARIQREEEAYQRARERRRLELREWANARHERLVSETPEPARVQGDREDLGHDGQMGEQEGADQDDDLEREAPDHEDPNHNQGARHDEDPSHDEDSGHGKIPRSRKFKPQPKREVERKGGRGCKSTAMPRRKAKPKPRRRDEVSPNRKGRALPRRGNARDSSSDDGHRGDRTNREGEEDQGGEGNQDGEGARDGNAGDDEDLDDEDQDDDDSIVTAVLVYYPTMRERARRKNFAPRARALVDYLVERVHFRAVAEDAYADITPVNSEADEDGNVFQEGVVFDQIAIEEWRRANRELREGLEPFPLLKEYVVYAKHVYTQVRNDVKTVALGYVETSYDLGLEFDPDDVMTRVESLLNDSFHSATLEPGRHDFHHPILPNCIRQAHFDVPGKAIGYKYAPRFTPMPLPTIALHCATIRFLISTYESGYPYKKAPLDASNQREWFVYYLNHLKDAALPGHNPRRIMNLRKRLFDLCHRVAKPNHVPPALQQRVYEADSDEDYVSMENPRGQS